LSHRWVTHHEIFHSRSQLGPSAIFSCKVSIQAGLVLLSQPQIVYLKTELQIGKCPGGGKEGYVQSSLAEQHRGTSERLVLRAEESTGSYKLLINVG